MSMDYQATDAVYKARAAVAESRDVWLDPLCSSLPTGRKGPFLVRADGSLLTVDRIGLLSSRDDGATWGEPIPAALGQNPQEPASCAVVEPIPGTLVMVYLDMRTRRFAWNAAVGEPGDEARLEMHTARSVDGGRTWGDARRLLSGYNGNFFGFIRTRSGRLVVAAEHLIGDPGRWVVCSFTSDDDGRTWTGRLMLDERVAVSYPDGAQDERGNVYVVHDRDRYGAREILMSRFTEDDILAGRLVSEGSRLRQLVSQATG